MRPRDADPSRKLGRRQFIVTAAAAAGVGRSLLAQETAGEEKWRMRLSTSSIHYTSLPIEEACAEIARLGFEAIDIWSAHAGCPHLDDVLERLGPDGLKDVLAKHRLTLFAFSTYKGGYAKYAELLGEAGGGVAVQGSGKPSDPEDLTASMRAFLEKTKPLVELAEQHDSYLAIENHGGALLNTIDSLKAFVDLNDSARLGIALAPYHVQGINASVPEAIEACGGQLLFFYAWQRAKGVEQLPGVGPTDMAPWIAALAKVRYRSYVNPFMHHEPEPEVMSEHLATARDYLRAVRASLRE
ncbi:MAG: sugar phosphate isomerase/epimerase [Armatimonadota bacterium]|jgi:sugar phosphate isomerase/epimerase